MPYLEVITSFHFWTKYRVKQIQNAYIRLTSKQYIDTFIDIELRPDS